MLTWYAPSSSEETAETLPATTLYTGITWKETRVTFTEVTRYAISIGYAAATVALLLVASRIRRTDPAQPVFFAAAAASGLWAGWYTALAWFDLSPFGVWGAFNRALHLPVIAVFMIAAWSRRRQRIAKEQQ